MKILVASVTNKEDEILTPHLDSIRSQILPPKVEIDLAYIVDGISSTAFLLEDRVAEALPKPDGAFYEVTEETHEWDLPTFGWLAREKQRLLDLAVEERYDAIFFVDSDLVLGPDTLASLIHAEKDVTSAVFWTAWQRGAPELPQVWMSHPYEFSGRGVHAEEFLRRLELKSLIPVGGLGACTLIRSRVFKKVRWFPLLEGLPSGGMWQGEDRHFCIHAARNHVELWADAYPDIFHIYRPSDLGNLPEWRLALPELVDVPELGDWVSLSLEAVEERELHARKEHLRGRLGALRILPQIEKALYSMHVGDAKVVKVSFPLWWEIEEYRGKTKSILVRLLGAKRYDGS